MVFSLEFLDLVQKILDDEPGHNHGVVDLTGDEDLTDEDGDTGMGDSTGVSVSLGGEISSGGKKSRESNICGGTIAGRAIITWGGGMASYAASLKIIELGFELEDSKMGQNGSNSTRTPRIRALGLQGLDSFLGL
ncbi:hypothetical protein Tco_0461049 [Tanacetum coccineum]